ncbi:MAG TPA: helix-turn-helix domain-containing protein [Methanomassiliicoccales archaeon]|nr:TrmB family transcriptional regulator [Methanomassiliicoccales archaeon]HNX48314.1 helix-turn-helix domain-containing protein [Methanomassiliicoccales archaeon]HPR99001.1 helix-turn-helix domain-containing protein [Methanomassiliicoccales archaeon]HSA35830.1 helix-turn-helix domain-containing protein [Methanomassiliicoccales archaeon]
MNIVDVLRLDISDVEKEFAQIASALGNLGLSNYESRAYVALLLRAHATAEDIAELAVIPRTSAYKSLQSLVTKGFAQCTEGRPAIYHPLDIEELRERTMNEMNGMFAKLSSIKGLLSEKGTPELVFTIYGRKKVLMKIGEMLDSARETFMISSPKMQDIRSDLSDRFKDAQGRGVKITIITEPGVKVPSANEIFRRKGLIATDVIVDGRIAMIATEDLDLCGFSDNPLIAGHLENFLHMVKGSKK